MLDGREQEFLKGKLSGFNIKNITTFVSKKKEKRKEKQKKRKTSLTPYYFWHRSFARWRHFTTTTRILFVLPLIFKSCNPSEV